jgi:hypothetical protein
VVEENGGRFVKNCEEELFSAPGDGNGGRSVVEQELAAIHLAARERLKEDDPNPRLGEECRYPREVLRCDDHPGQCAGDMFELGAVKYADCRGLGFLARTSAPTRSGRS